MNYIWEFESSSGFGYFSWVLCFSVLFATELAVTYATE